VDECNIEELLEADLTKEELLELEQKRIAEEEAREKKTAGEVESLRKFTVMGLAEAFSDLNKLLKNFENMYPNNERFSLIERIMHYLLARKSMMKKQTKQTTMDI